MVREKYRERCTALRYVLTTTLMSWWVNMCETYWVQTKTKSSYLMVMCVCVFYVNACFCAVACLCFNVCVCVCMRVPVCLSECVWSLSVFIFESDEEKPQRTVWSKPCLMMPQRARAALSHTAADINILSLKPHSTLLLKFLLPRLMHHHHHHHTTQINTDITF